MYLDWNKTDRQFYVIDIETESLNPSKIWCMCWKNIKTGETGECISLDQIRSFFGCAGSACFIGHNLIGFDSYVLNRLAGTRLSPSNSIDTLILSTLYNPSLEGGHSLAAWGETLGKDKIDFNDWSKLSSEMLTYCHRDVEITAELFIKLVRVLNKINFSEKSIWIQHRFIGLLERQKKNGFYFDGQRAITLYQEIRKAEDELTERIRNVFPAELSLHCSYQNAFKNNGDYTKRYDGHVLTYPKVELLENGGYRTYGYVDFNIGSPKQRIAKLLALGWEPEEFTAVTANGGGGNPRPFDHGDLSPSLKQFLEDKDVPEVELIARWMSFNGRANMINTWMDNWNENTHCIHGSLFVAGTLRVKHSKPNTANIPGVRVDKSGIVLRGEQGYYTYESRDLWTARPNRFLVGTDAAGLELRMLANALNRPAFTDTVLNGDPHQYNADTVGITRPLAKTLLYAIQYGAQAGKVASIIKSTKPEGAKIRQQFLDRLGLTGVMESAQSEQANGRIELVDGSMVRCPSPHSSLNYKLQGSGARVMAMGAIILEQYIRRDGLDSLKVGDIHDEWQYDVHPRDAERHAKRSVQAIREAGEELNLNIALDGTAKKGLTWAETH